MIVYELSNDQWVVTDSLKFNGLAKATRFFGQQPSIILNGVYLYEAPDKPKTILLETAELTDKLVDESFDDFVNRVVKVPPLNWQR